MMNKPTIKVGASVRFLNAVGGGRVARITKDTAWVEDADGFEIPTPLSECVLVEEGDTFMPKYKPPTFLHTKEVERQTTAVEEPRHRMRVEDFEDFSLTETAEPSEPKRLPHTFLPAKGEFHARLAFIPRDMARLGNSPYDWYLINDSDYSLYYVLLVGREGSTPSITQHGILYPHKDIYLGTIEPSELTTLERIQLEGLAFAENPGTFKENLRCDIRFDARKLLRPASFGENDFFEDKAFVLECKQGKSEASVDLSVLAQLNDNHSQSEAKKSVYHLSPETRESQRKQTATATNEPIVVDLHIDELLETTAGMTNADILSYQVGIFNKTMQAHLAHQGRKLIFIHGKGDGVLRKKILEELRYRYKSCSVQDASFQQYSYGATQVTIGRK